MGQSYKVFIKDKVLVFTQNINNSFLGEKDIIHKYKSQKKLSSEFQSFIENKKQENLYVICDTNVDKFFNKFISKYHIIKASGGLVTNKMNQILLIYRHGRWDIPKGKNNKNEKNKSAALREVEEETGISKLQIIKKLANTYHFFSENKTLYIKKTRWYLMNNTQDQIPESPNNEGITKVAWFDYTKLDNISKGAYLSVKEVIALAEKSMKK